MASEPIDDRMRAGWWQSTCAYWKTTADEANWRIIGLSAGFESACNKLDELDAQNKRLRAALSALYDATADAPEVIATLDGYEAFADAIADARAAAGSVLGGSEQ